jgi:hypothetical protein
MERRATEVGIGGQYSMSSVSGGIVSNQSEKTKRTGIGFA